MGSVSSSLTDEDYQQIHNETGCKSHIIHDLYMID